MADIVDALICATSSQLVRDAVNILEAHPSCGMDAIHLGPALASLAEGFVAADVAHRGRGRTPARDVYKTLTCTLRGCACSALGMVSLSTPFLNSAPTLLASSSLDRVNTRR